MALSRTILSAMKSDLSQKLKAREELDADIVQLRQLIKVAESQRGPKKPTLITSNGQIKRKLLTEYVLEILEEGAIKMPDMIRRLREQNVKLSKENPNASVLYAMRKLGRVQRLNEEYRLIESGEPALKLHKPVVGKNAPSQRG